MSLVRRLRRIGRGDAGFALPTVLGIGVVMLLMAGVASVATSSIQQKTQVDSDWTAAYYAANSGLSDYQSRLASISNYNLYGNPAAAFSQGSAPLTLPPTSDPLYNPAFSIDTSPTTMGTWAKVPCRSTCGPTVRLNYFRYEVNTADFSTRGIIHVRATGRVGTQVRSVIADFRRNGLFNFVYYTNYEIQDPTISGDDSACARYPWSSPKRADSCGLVQFGRYDTLNGDIFSNDQFFICGSNMLGRVQSAAPTGNAAYITDDCANGTPAPTFAYTPQNVASISLPPSNATLSTEARADTYTGSAAGCMYTGPTTITMTADGKMKVISPLTKMTQPSFTAGVPSKSPASCGVPGTGSGQLGNIDGATIDVPADNLIYVQSVPSATTDPNFTAVGSTTGWSTATSNNTTFSCFGQAANGYSNDATVPPATLQGWKLVKQGGSGGNGSVQYPAANEDYVPTPTGAAAYQCTAGDAYVSGTLKGHVTIATDRNIYITGNLDYAASAPANSTYNLLGLVANVAVVVWNPQNWISQSCVSYDRRGNCTNWDTVTSNILTDTDRLLKAAALAVKGTVMVQNYNVGSPRGTLNLVGSIEQNFRGTVATGSGDAPTTGYKKNYVYDANLRYNAPPKYLAPQNATFAVSQIASVPKAFNANGSPRP